jgi:hypothetical protein
MAISKDLFMAILSMDAYNRGADSASFSPGVNVREPTFGRVATKRIEKICL